MRKLILLLLLASPVSAQWANFGTNILGNRFDPATLTHPTDTYTLQFQASTKKWIAAAGGGGSPTGAAGGFLSGVYPSPGPGNGGTSSQVLIGGSPMTFGVAPIAAVPTGVTGSTVPFGNDSRFNLTPSSAGKIPVDTGSAYGAIAVGSTSQVLVGGASPAFGAVPIAAVPTGQTGSTVPFGNDTRFNPTPSTAGKIPYDTGTGYSKTATAGSTTQVLHGGTTPAYGQVVVADISSGAASSGQVPTADGAGNTSWATPSGGTSSTTPTGFPDTSTVQKFLVPLYIYPTLSGWTNYYATSPKTGIVIANPSSGPGGSANSDYTTGIAGMHTNGIQVLGYVHTRVTPGGAFRALATVESEVDSWYSFYPTIDGIFFDEADAAGGATEVTYFTALWNYVRGKGTRNMVVLNPGTNCAEAYAGISDIIVTSENTYATYSGSYTVDAWAWKYKATHFCHIVHTCTPTNMTAAINLTKKNRAGYVYVTDDAATYTVNPSYLTEAITTIGLVDGRFPMIYSGINATTNVSPTTALRFAGANGIVASHVQATTVEDVTFTPTYGTLVNTFAQGNDSRLSDARTPTSVTQKRNLLINGDFKLWNRGATTFTPATATDTYTTERWRSNNGTGGASTISRQAHTVGQALVPNEPQYYLRHVQGTNGTGAVYEAQAINDVRTAAGQSATVSVYLRISSGSATVTPKIIQSFGTGGSPHADVPTTGSGWTVNSASFARFTYTFTVPSISGFTVGTTDGTSYLDLQIGLPVSSTYTIDIADVQFEIGTAATSYQRRPYADELFDSESYHSREIADTANYNYGPGYATTTTATVNRYNYHRKMRAIPTITLSAAGTFRISHTGTATTASAVGSSFVGLSGCQITASVASGLSADSGVALQDFGSSTSFIDIDAEF